MEWMTDLISTNQRRFVLIAVFAIYQQSIDAITFNKNTLLFYTRVF